MHDHDILLLATGHQGRSVQYPDCCNYMPHRHVRVRAFSDEWSVHDRDFFLPAAGRQGHDAQHPDYRNHMSLRYVQVRAFSDKW